MVSDQSLLLLLVNFVLGTTLRCPGLILGSAQGLLETEPSWAACRARPFTMSPLWPCFYKRVTSVCICHLELGHVRETLAGQCCLSAVCRCLGFCGVCWLRSGPTLRGAQAGHVWGLVSSAVLSLVPWLFPDSTGARERSTSPSCLCPASFPLSGDSDATWSPSDSV